MENKNGLMQEIIVKWLNEHPYLSQNALCKEVGIDRGNFFRTVKTGLPALREDVIKKIVKVLGRYGFPMQVANGKIVSSATSQSKVKLNNINEKSKPKVVTAPSPKSNYSINTKPGSSKADRLRDLRGKK